MFVRTIIIIKRVSILALLVFVCYWKYKFLFLEWNCYFSALTKRTLFYVKETSSSQVYFDFCCVKTKDTKQLKVVIIVHYHFWYLVMFFLTKNITLWKKLRKSDLLTNWYWFSIFYVKQLFIMWFTVLEYVDLDSNAKTTTFCIRCTLNLPLKSAHFFRHFSIISFVLSVSVSFCQNLHISRQSWDLSVTYSITVDPTEFSAYHGFLLLAYLSGIEDLFI